MIHELQSVHERTVHHYMPWAAVDGWGASSSTHSSTSTSTSTTSSTIVPSADWGQYYVVHAKIKSPRLTGTPP
jgi:hypothetical protein